MDILLVAKELFPYFRLTPLAEYTACLAKAMRGLGHRPTLVLPKLKQFESSGLLLARRLTPLKVTLNQSDHDIYVYDTRTPAQIDVVLVDVDFGTKGGQELFSHAVSELVNQRFKQGQFVDIVHVQDVELGGIIRCLRERKQNDPFLLEVGLVCGFVNHCTKNDKKSEYVKTLWDADAALTTSPSYALECTRDDKLSAALRSFASKWAGVLAGIDLSTWNPSVDPHLPARFDAESRETKLRCKGHIQGELGLRVDLKANLIVIPEVDRFFWCSADLKTGEGDEAQVPTKTALRRASLWADFCVKMVRDAGDWPIQIVAYSAPQLSSERKHDLADEYSLALESFVRGLEGQQRSIVFLPHPSESVQHRLLAGAQFVSQCSMSEPHGLWAMIGQKYGAVPIVSSVGAHQDIVVDVDIELETGTGVKMPLFSAPKEDGDDAFMESVHRAHMKAAAAYVHDRYTHLQRRVMKLDRGWDRPARLIERLYKSSVSS